MNEKKTITRREVIKGCGTIGAALTVGALGFREIRNRTRRDYQPEVSQRYLDSIPKAKDPSTLPNIIIVFTDDLGYGDVSVYGSQAIQTPNIDAMATEGCRLTNFYSTAPLCSPSRAGLLTGRYPIRTMVTAALYPSGSLMTPLLDLAGFNTLGVRGIPEDEVLLPEALQRRGYRTGLVGKWHLGDRSPHLPLENGFDEFYGALYSNDMGHYQIFRNADIEIDHPVDQDQITQNMTAEALRFIEINAGKPFFLYLAHPMPHEPVHASEAFRGTSAAGLYGDSVTEIDWSMGVLLETLKRHGIDERTLVIFTSDNGPWWQGNPGAIRGRKNLPFEGGYRVPFIARWPGTIPEGIVRDQMSMNFDLFSLCMDIAGIHSPNNRVIDGVSLLPLLKGEESIPHETLFFYKGNDLVGVRHHGWKYLRRHMTDNGGYASLSQGPFLFNLATDPNESYSLIESKPEIARKLAAMLDDFDQGIETNIRGWQ